MKLAIITDAYPPMRSSGAVLMRDLCVQLADIGHEVTVMVPAPQIDVPYTIEQQRGVRIARLKTMETRDRPYAIRVGAELAMPYLMQRQLRASGIDLTDFDGVIWYSPSIFFGPLAKYLKNKTGAPGYLILRDIFPEWAADLGLMKRGVAFRALQKVARQQYQAADVIGVQTPGNVPFFGKDIENGKQVEVLQNWIDPGEPGECSIDIASTSLRGRTIFAYTGNMGVAQGMDKLIDLATELREDDRAGFLFVGRGSEVSRLQALAEQRSLSNCLFHDEIGIDEMPGLFEQVHVGMVSLDNRHKWHNIPGKFIAYTHAGLSVLASVNPGNDMIDLVEAQRVGQVSTDPDGRDLPALARKMLDDDLGWDERRRRSQTLAQNLFSVEAAAKQIEDAIESLSSRQSR